MGIRSWLNAKRWRDTATEGRPTAPAAAEEDPAVERSRRIARAFRARLRGEGTTRPAEPGWGYRDDGFRFRLGTAEMRPPRNG